MKWFCQGVISYAVIIAVNLGIKKLLLLYVPFLQHSDSAEWTSWGISMIIGILLLSYLAREHYKSK